MMKKTLLLLLLCYGLNAQHTISGTFSPAKEYTWLIAYHLKPGTKNYIADTAIKKGEFTLNISENKPTGIYRLVYGVPQEEFYFDVIYNGKEDIKLNFTLEEGVMFLESTENIPFGTYFTAINKAEQDLISYYTSAKTDVTEYNTIKDRLSTLQKSSEKQSEGLLANEFIIANRPYIPSGVERLADYVSNKKKKYFQHLDVTNARLQASGFLTDKLLNYVFTALPLEQVSDSVTQLAMRKNTETIAQKLGTVNSKYRFSVFYTLWSQAAASKLNEVSDFVYKTYLKELALSTDNTQAILDIEAHNRLRLGAIAPDIVWVDDKKELKLSELEAAERYILVFWSSTCGHCLNELPALHKELRKHPSVKVLAVGLEDHDISWKNEAKKLPNFEHTIALGKWDSEYADLYNITATPTYFVLDSDKRIIAKPENDEAVIRFVEKND